MKYSIALLAAAASFVTAQAPADLPACGQTCINNMIGVASTDFGCQPGDVACYCQNVDFGYGVRDCSNAVCSPEEAAQVIGYGTQYCASALAQAGASPTNAPTPTSDEEDGVSTAISTSALVAVITSGSDTITTTTGFSTIYSNVAAGISASASSALESAASSASDALSSVEASLSDAASSALASVSSDASAALSSGASDASSAAESATETATESAEETDSASATEGASSTGGAPIQTAAPILGAAGIAALLLL